jgi:hypothetical protein
MKIDFSYIKSSLVSTLYRPPSADTDLVEDYTYTARFTFTHCNQMYETGSIQATANQTNSLACEQLRRKKCPVYTNSLICSNIIFVRQLFNMSAVHSSKISLYISNFHLPNTSLIENMKTVLRAVANFPKFD